MTRVKICGITCREDLRVAVDSGADAVGLLVDVPVDSPREVDPKLAAELADATPPFVTTVLVTMGETPERVAELAQIVTPDAVQVHGQLGAGDLAYLTADLDAQVLKSVDAANPEQAREYDGVADALLVDSVDEEGAGGTGQTHDWDRTAKVTADLDSPVILAGGLVPENVADAVETVEPFAVDVASGVESTGGEKSAEAVAEFVRNAKRRHATAKP